MHVDVGSEIGPKVGSELGFEENLDRRRNRLRRRVKAKTLVKDRNPIPDPSRNRPDPEKSSPLRLSSARASSVPGQTGPN